MQQKTKEINIRIILHQIIHNGVVFVCELLNYKTIP